MSEQLWETSLCEFVGRMRDLFGGEESYPPEVRAVLEEKVRGGDALRAQFVRLDQLMQEAERLRQPREHVAVSRLPNSFRHLLRRSRSRTAADPDPGRPPSFGAFLLCLMSGKDWEPVLGDLEEDYQKIRARFGQRRADFWYRTQVVRSIIPLLGKGARAAVLAWLGEIIRRMIG